MSKKGLLIRVGIDSVYGEWNAPINTNTGDFVYLPIPESDQHKLKSSLIFPYDHFISDLKEFSYINGLTGKKEIPLPSYLSGVNTHLDPDFNYLTYGDNGEHRGKELKHQFHKGDFIVFYAGLKPINHYEYPLCYAIIGFYEIDKVITAGDIAEEDSIINAHTRKQNPNPNDVLVIANPQNSGRLEKCIEIGEYRDRAYRIRADLLELWGGISAKDGYLQRSAVLPKFNDPENFLKWFAKQNVKLLRSNN